MSCKSALYCINTNNPTIVEGATIPVGTTVRRFGPNIRLDGTGILIRGTGYYDIDASFTIVPEAVGTITIQLYQDGTPISGALASTTVAATDTSEVLTIPAVIRLKGCCNDESSNLEFKLTGGNATLSNAAVVVEKI